MTNKKGLLHWHQLKEDGARQGLDDGHVVVGVHLFHDVAEADVMKLFSL